MTTERPLEGRTVLVTRSRDQYASLAGPLEALGAEAVACPVIKIVDPVEWIDVDRAIEDIATFDWIIFSSPNAVSRFAAQFDLHAMDPAEVFAASKIAVVGSGTAKRLATFGKEPDLVPDQFTGEGLVEAFREIGAGPGWKILIPRALEGRDVLPDGLTEMGAEPTVVAVYRTVREVLDRDALKRLRAGEIDAVTFTSPSTFLSFVSLLEGRAIDVRALLGSLVTASIGPVTTEAMQMRGYDPTIEAKESSIPGLVEAIAEHFSAV